MAIHRAQRKQRFDSLLVCVTRSGIFHIVAKNTSTYKHLTGTRRAAICPVIFLVLLGPKYRHFAGDLRNMCVVDDGQIKEFFIFFTTEFRPSPFG